ncbi:MAG TPA: hypothetical protein PK668_17815 [Myxococcota bacterium]|nr:hypothetical protein [Myxococcota bacterium]HRY95819.1 hypothetical protein [Myxococcota bacterium]HSA22749.1 hypothetical protein [Myxococcota bacterium]
MQHIALLVLAGCLFGIALGPSPASAQDACLAGVKSSLDGIERKVPALKKGDGKTANSLIKEINEAKAKLNTCDRSQPGWAEQGQRANWLDAWTRAQALGQPRPAAAGPDEWTPKAVAELDLVEKDLAALKPGDAATTNALVLRLNGVRDLLRKSLDRSQPAWKEAAARADALDKAARARYAEGQPAAPGAAGGLPTVAMLPEDLGKGLDINDKYVFTSELEPTFKDTARMVNASDPRAWADDWQAGKVTGPLERMQKSLARIKNQTHPGVQQARAALVELERVFGVRQAEGRRLVAAEKAAATAEAGEVDTQLAEIETFFNPETFSCKLEPPFTGERVGEWIAQLKEYDQLKQKGLNLLDKVVHEHPGYAQNQRIKNLRYWFTQAMPKRMARDIGLTTLHYQDGPSGYQGKMAFHLERAQRYLKPGVITEEMLSRDQLMEDKLAEAELGVQAAEALALFTKEYLGQDDADYRKAAADCHALLDRLQTGATKAMANVRMPAAKSSDAGLLQVAKGVVAKCGVGPYERMVINYGPAHKTERKSEAKVEGEYLRIWHWTEEWDEFQVTLAERFDASPFGPSKVAGAKADAGPHHRLVFYTLKKLTVGPKWKTLGKWVCADRIVSKKIAKENIQK